MSGKSLNKEIKEPDFLQTQMTKLMVLYDRHRKIIMGFLVGLLIVLAISSGWSLYRFNYEKSALKLYNQLEVEASSGQGAEHAAKLLAGYQSVTVKYPHSKAGLYAFYQLGNQYFHLRQYDKALGAYDEFLKKAEAKNFLKVFANTGRGYCYEEQKKFPKALIAFETALKMPEGQELAGQIYRDMGRIYGKMNDLKKCREYFGKALDKTKDREMAEMLKRKLATLN